MSVNVLNINALIEKASTHGIELTIRVFKAHNGADRFEFEWEKPGEQCAVHIDSVQSFIEKADELVDKIIAKHS